MQTKEVKESRVTQNVYVEKLNLGGFLRVLVLHYFTL